MTTQRINDQYDVTMAGPRKLAKGYEVVGTIWNRQTQKSTKITVRGEGRTISSAQARAFAEATQKCPSSDDD
jgi:hypothetical protein